MPPCLILFAGAPASASLDWEAHHLIEELTDPVARFAGLLQPDRDVVPETPETASAHPSWRTIPLDRQHLPTGFSQSLRNQNAFHNGGPPMSWEQVTESTSFFVASQIDEFIEEASQAPDASVGDSSIESAREVLSQFYEESYALHQDLASSQIAPASSRDSSFTSDGYTQETSSFVSLSGLTTVVPVAGRLSSLKDIPNAVYLNSIQPQTMTVNLIVGIIAIPSPRAIRTRRGARVELMEVLVGDESRSGFGINFWLPGAQSGPGVMENTLSGLRPQDIVLIRNVGLGCFRNKVYGQSLRKELTKVHLLYRNRVDKTDSGGCYSAADFASGRTSSPQIDKTNKVREWVMRFVGVGAATGKKEKRSMVKMLHETLPPDTQ